ncbi:extensin family protein [Parerythrobacter aurantius]
MRLLRIALVLAALVALGLAAREWIRDNPGHNPWAPLDLRDPPGWATQRKLVALRDDAALCRAVLERSTVAFTVLGPAGDGPCRRADRTILTEYPLSPAEPPTTCAVAAGLQIWLDRGVQPAARTIFGEEVAQIEHFGSYSCRRLYGGSEGPWSEHATGNAIDIAGFVLADGRRISVLADWPGSGPEAKFLRQVRASACDAFGTVLSPDYNTAHADHFHLDQKAWGFSSVCR